MLREEFVRVGRFCVLGAVAVVAGCATTGPAHFGQYNEFGPKVAATKGERSPLHLTVQLDKPANVAVFLVAPGRASVLLFPQDSTANAFVEAGAHTVETSLARNPPDTSRNARGPGQPQQQQGRQQQGGRGRGQEVPTFGFNQRGYLLIYASQEPLPYSALSTRVAGISVPFDDTDALNTVTKLIRQTTGTTGRWAGFATDFPP